MLRLHLLRPLALLVLATGCAASRQPGALSPLGARVTNEVITDDARAFDMWARRLEVVRQAGDGAPAARAYATARAAAWLDYARQSYAWDPRDGTADEALAETRRIVVALEAGGVPDFGALPLVTDLRARPDLWSALERARFGQPLQESPAAIAEAEVALVRASRLAIGAANDAPSRPMTDYERACELQLQVATAERLITGLTVAPPPTVALQGTPVVTPAVAAPSPAPVIRAPVAPPRTEARPLERVVHFAVNSSTLALRSRMTLGSVISILRSHPKVNLVIKGYTDMRGGETLNRRLAERRAEAVRRYLEGANLDLGRVTVAGIGTDSTAMRHASAELFARDRRVTLSFTGPDGQPLSVAAYQALDVDHERDLQVEQDQRRRTRAVRPRTDGASRQSTPR